MVIESRKVTKAHSQGQGIKLLVSPLIDHYLGILRDKNTPPEIFRSVVANVGRLLSYEMTCELDQKAKTIETPLMTTKAHFLDPNEMALISILRAGNGLLEGAAQMIPFAPVGFLGLERDASSHLIKNYYLKLPQDIHKRTALVFDPMLATGHTLAEGLKVLEGQGCKKIIFGCLVAAPEGVEFIRSNFPKLEIYSAALDERLNEKGYILPGLGDAGDRIYGT